MTNRVRFVPTARWRSIAAAAALTAGAASVAHAQWVTSITRPVFSTGPTTVYKVDDATGVSTEIFDPLNPNTIVPATAPGFTGLAADNANSRIFASTTNGTKSDIYVLDYADPDNVTATFLVALTRPESTTGMVVDGLAYDTQRGVLYATRTLGGAGQLEGLYSIDTTTGQTTLIFEYEPSTGSTYTIGGIDYDPIADRIYFADDDDTGGRNLYFVEGANPAGGLQLLMAYPAGVTDVDGLAAHGGRLFLLSDSQDDTASAAIEGNGGLHYVIDVATTSVLGTITSPYPLRTVSTQLGRIDPTGGAAWAPGLFPSACIGDYDMNGTADLLDLLAFVNDWTTLLGTDVPGGAAADINNDLTVDLLDLLAFLSSWLEGCD